MTRGRPSLGPEIVDHLPGSQDARNRLKIVLRVLCGQMTVPQACEELGINESRFHVIKMELMARALEAAEPKPMGRPAKVVTPEQQEIARLKHELVEAKIDLQAAHIREALAIAMPHVLHPDRHSSDDKKKRR